jgi:hypothetical protein
MKRGNMAGTRYIPSILKLQRLYGPLKADIDILSDPTAEDSDSWYLAYGRVLYLISNPEIWEFINRIMPGNKSNFLLHNLGAERMAWLREFYDENVPEKVKAG